MARNAGLMYTYDFEGFWAVSDGVETLKDSWKKFASFTNDVDLETSIRWRFPSFNAFLAGR
ncbi:uncharacterized protein A1O5_11251 [Cladophialophora psammophila CBS 110553]|uniref:Uncharacterized protein n=1 Tax=Cladophialophora psammophila CBS 110553 TaxID=1182543 RepID=W9WCM8_9EURO|nr:uncharacterized protein A1O5_11251 [Cladophialophora psammophila CBS 110553]EXJ65723.1 hypothetical protein A1O5_11251 [Cladophialophora psammophila CBS 110553]